MKQWLISKIPAWFLHYWVWRNWRLVCSGHPRYAFCIEADIELWLRAEGKGTSVFPDRPCLCDYTAGKNCEVCRPLGVPEWLLTNPESYGYEDEPDDRRLR